MAGMARGSFGFGFCVEALFDGIENGDGVEAEFFGVALVQDFLDKLVEEVGGAAMGGDDVHAARPKDAGVADGEEAAVGGVEGEFVEDAVAAFAGLGVGLEVRLKMEPPLSKGRT